MLWNDTRAQSIQIGAVLLFGILIILLATWQAYGVPNQNEEIEFNHNLDVQEEMTDLRDTAVSMPGTITSQSASVDLGVRYPTRVLTVNPGPASGTLRTIGTTNESHKIIIENASAVATGDDISVDDFWDGSEQTYNTGALEYRPGYNLYQNAPNTIYEHSVLFNEFEQEEATLPITEQVIIDNNRITLIALNGSLSESRAGRASVDFKPVSTQTRSIDVTDDGDAGNITLHLPTKLSVEEWVSLVSEEDAVNVTASDRFDSGIELEFDSGQYELQLAKIGVGTKVTETEKAYLNGIDGNEATISDDQNQSLTVEVRDKFNNPKRSVLVNGSAEDGTLTETDLDTGSNGQVTFEYDPDSVGVPGQTQTRQINFSIAYSPVADTEHNISTSENITMTVNVESSEQPQAGDGQSAFTANWSVDENPRGGDTIEAQDGIEGGSCDPGPCVFNQTEEGGDLKLPMHTSPEVDNASVSFAVSDTDIASIPNSEHEITDGTAIMTLSPDEDAEGETVTVFTWSGGSGDRVKILLENVTQDAGDTLPDDHVAFNDRNNNGVYDSGKEATYSEQDIKGFENESVDLVIEKDISHSGSWAIEANTTTVEEGVTVESTNNDLEIATDGDIDISGATIRGGGDSELDLEAENGDIDARDAIIESNGDLTAKPDENGFLKVNEDTGNGGTRIQDLNGDEKTLELEQGTLDGEPEHGSVNVNN